MMLAGQFKTDLLIAERTYRMCMYNNVQQKELGGAEDDHGPPLATDGDGGAQQHRLLHHPCSAPLPASHHHPRNHRCEQNQQPSYKYRWRTATLRLAMLQCVANDPVKNQQQQGPHMSPAQNAVATAFHQAFHLSKQLLIRKQLEQTDGVQMP